MVLDPVRPCARPGVRTQVRAREGAGQASEGVRVTGGAGSPAYGGERLVGEEQEAQQRGGQGFFGDPPGARESARIGLRLRDPQGVVHLVQDGQALVPPALGELGRAVVLRELPQIAQPPLPVDGPALSRVFPQHVHELARPRPVREQAYGVCREIAGGQRCRVPVRERGLQLRHSRPRLFRQARHQTDRRHPHVRTAPFGTRLARLLPAPLLMSSSHATRQVRPGARLFSGERHHSAYSSRTGRTTRAGASGPRSLAVRSPRPKASVICVSSVTIAGVGRSIARQGPHLARICGTSLNSVGKPSASPIANPIIAPTPACLPPVRKFKSLGWVRRHRFPRGAHHWVPCLCWWSPLRAEKSAEP